MKAQMILKTMGAVMMTGLVSVAAQADLEIPAPCPAIYISVESTVIATLQSEAYKMKADIGNSDFGLLQGLQVRETNKCLTREVLVRDNQGQVIRFLAEYNLRDHQYKVQLLNP